VLNVGCELLVVSCGKKEIIDFILAMIQPVNYLTQ